MTRALATVDLGALGRNVERLRRNIGETRLCVVVKADGYGHGASAVARAARAAGAQWLAVAGAQEAADLRRDGIAGPILVMGSLDRPELEQALGAGADIVAWREDFARAAADVIASREGRAGGGATFPRPARVHVKLDTGMGRLGTSDPAEADRVAAIVDAADGLELVGAMSHFATADDRGDPFMDEQLARFLAWAGPLRDRHPGLILHTANSAGALRDPATHLGMVRCGIAAYGLDPFGEDAAARGLEPVLSLSARVGDIKELQPGQSAGYGRRFVADRPTRLAVLPIGYGDGFRRGLSDNAEVLIGGRRHPVVGTVSMDNVTVEIGAAEVAVGEEAVLIGAQGAERISAEELARRLGTINYEVTCGLLPRVPRRHLAS